MNICESCGKEYEYNRKRNSTKKCASCHVNNRRLEVKKRAVEALGGKCIMCGYEKSIYALDFHHIDPSTKSFNISGNHARTWKRIEEEIKKCVLLCANCHRELYHNILIVSNPATLKLEGQIPTVA